MADVLPQTRMNRTISHMPGVRKAVKKYAERKAKLSKAKLAASRNTGNAFVEVKQGYTDAVISLVDNPTSSVRGAYRHGNARAIEFGHNIVRNGVVVGRAPGLYIITGPIYGWQ